MALCCLKTFNWDEIINGKGKGGSAAGGSAAGGLDGTEQLAPYRATEHTPLAKVL